jgi:chromosome segregation ATPase
MHRSPSKVTTPHVDSQHHSDPPAEHIEATSVTAEFSSLTKSILDARLALTRLRQTHPSPKLTIPSALAHLDAQSTSLQTLDEELSSLRRQVAAAKDRIKVEGRAIEQLRAERADLTKAVRDHSKADEDSSLVPIYDWQLSSLLARLPSTH